MNVKNGQVAIKIGTTLDNSDVTTWLFMELHEIRRSKLADRIRKGRGICVQGYIREYRKEDSDVTLPSHRCDLISLLVRKENELMEVGLKQRAKLA